MIYNHNDNKKKKFIIKFKDENCEIQQLQNKTKGKKIDVHNHKKMYQEAINKKKEKHKLNKNVVLNTISNTTIAEFDNFPELLTIEATQEDIDKLYTLDVVEFVSEDKHVASGSSQSFDWGYTKTKVDTRYRGTITGKGVRIGIVDSGCYQHSDLPSISGWVDFVNGRTSPYDDLYHGTCVTGIISGQDNDSGYVGVAPDASIYHAKVLNDKNLGTTSNIVKGIDWAINQNVHIINLSISTFSNNPSDSDVSLILDATRRAYNAGIIVVSCSGNGEWVFDGQNQYWDNVGKSYVKYPAKDYSCIAVGSINQSNVRSSFSNYGSGLNYVAPGESVTSTNTYNGYTTRSGTSFATPYVVGHIACLMEETSNYSNSVLSTLQQNAQSIGSSDEYGYGLVMSMIPPIPSTPTDAPLIDTSFTNTDPKNNGKVEDGLIVRVGGSRYSNNYTVKYRRDDNASTVYSNPSSAKTGILKTGLGYGERYWLSYRGENETGVSDFSTENPATTCPMSSYPNVFSIYNDHVAISKTTQIGNWTYINIALYEGNDRYSGTFIETKQLTNGGSSLVYFYNLKPNTTYCVVARTYLDIYDNGQYIDTIGSLYWNDTTFTTKPDAPLAPTNVRLQSFDEGSLLIAWDASMYATGYVLDYINESTGTGSSLYVGGVTSYNLTNLQYGKMHRFQVRAYNSTGSSGWSDMEYAYTAPKTPTITLSNVSSNSISIQANLSEGAYDYIRVKRYSSSGEYIDSKDTNVNGGVVTWSNLQKNTTFSFEAQTYLSIADLWSVYESNTLTVTTSARPNYFSWSTPKVSGQPIQLTWQEWNDLLANINDVREYLGYSRYIVLSWNSSNQYTNTDKFQLGTSGCNFYAYMWNQAITALSTIGAIGLPSLKSKGNQLSTSDLNAIVTSLNNL